MSKTDKVSGITLSALVITIVVLLILAAITITILMTPGGIIKQSQRAQEEIQKAKYREVLYIIGEGLEPNRIIEKPTSKQYMDQYEEKIRREPIFRQADIIREDDETIRIITIEGYVYIITIDKIEYIGKKGENPAPDLQESDIEFTAVPSQWTNKKVTVEIKTKITGYILQYSQDGIQWEKYEEPIIVEQNGVIYARLINQLNEAGKYATGNINNIDRLPPKDFTPVVTATTNSITVTGSTIDESKTETDGSSGIAKYYFSKDNGTTWEPKDGQVEGNYTFQSLIQGQTYEIKMKVEDNAGNETVSQVESKKTENVPILITGSNVLFKYNPSELTKQNVIVTIEEKVGGYTLQYSKDASSWENYEGPIEMNQNGAIYARLIDASGQIAPEYATGNVANIDKLSPKQFTPTATSTASTITLTGSTVDVERTEENACSGIDKYYFSKDDGVTWEPSNGQTETTYTFNGLNQNQTYNLKMRVTDKVGNETITNAVQEKTKTIMAAEDGLTSGGIIATVTWSNERATVTLRTNTELKIEWQKYTNSGSWTEGTRVTELYHLDKVYARLTDGVNAGQEGYIVVRDDIKPVEAKISLDKGTTDTNTAVTGTVVQSDNESGVDIGKCKWVYNKNSGKIGLNESSYTGGYFSKKQQDISLKASEAGDYYLHVLTVDKAGNKYESVSRKVTVEQLATGISLNKTSATIKFEETITLTATITPTNTKNKEVTWKSSDTSVATVSASGVVERKKSRKGNDYSNYKRWKQQIGKLCYHCRVLYRIRKIKGRRLC